MAVKRVTPEDIIKMNEIYLICKNKAEVARQVGFSASTVSKYIISDFKSIPDNEVFIPFTEREIDLTMFEVLTWNDLIVLTDEERTDMESMRKEVML